MDDLENDSNFYSTKSTSKNSAEVQPNVIEETKTIRRILKATIVNNDNNPEACIEIELIHERLQNDNSTPPEAPKLTKLKAGEWTSCCLRSKTTLNLYKELQKLYALAEDQKVPIGQKTMAVIELESSENEQNIIKLLKQLHNSPDIAEQLASNLPDIVGNAQQIINLNKRKDGLARFKIMLKEKCSEQDWQDFFDEHDWVLGGTLEVQILGKVKGQPHLKGANIDGLGAKKGDFLVTTQGATKFSAVVEIKKPQTLLLNENPYRDGIFSASNELNGGVAQLRSYLKKWEIEGSRTEENKDILEERGIFTIQPRGILVIGHLDQIKGDRKKRNDFELYRQNQKDIYIVTFDEVYHRAEYILGHTK